MPRNLSGTSRDRTAAGAAAGPGAGGGGGARVEVTPSHRDLGLALYRVRLEKGLSLRALAQQLGYSAHSMFADLEKARRLPSESLLRSYEERFALPPRSLLDLRQQALIERAARIIASAEAPAPPVTPPLHALPAPPAPPAPEPVPEPAGSPQPPRAAERRAAPLVRMLRSVRDRVRGRRG